MSNIQIFNNPEFGEIRTVEINGEPWFVGKDVCKMFGDTNHNRTLGRVDELDKVVIPINDSLGRSQNITAINEGGLYAVLFAMQPQKANHDRVSDAYPIEIQDRIDKIRKFKRWVTSEVLPSIRKHGAYMTDATIEEALLNPDTLIRLATDLKAEREKRRALEVKVEADKPKVLFADAVTTARTSILIGELAKLLKQNGVDMGQNRLFGWMRSNGYLIKRKCNDYNMPTQRAMEQGLFEIKETAVTHADGHISVSKTPKVTGKGQQYFVEKFLGKR